MAEQSSSSTANRLPWEAPKLASLGMDLEDVRNGSANGNDGSGGFSATSAS